MAEVGVSCDYNSGKCFIGADATLADVIIGVYTPVLDTGYFTVVEVGGAVGTAAKVSYQNGVVRFKVALEFGFSGGIGVTKNPKGGSALLEVIIPIVVFLVIVLICFIVWRLNRLDKNKPFISSNAIVRKKRIDEWKNSVNSPLIKEYYVTFEIEGSDVKLKVPKYSPESVIQSL
ncbi:hypothetical protein [Paenibacillus sp. PL2-23]|uniref:hypothetical protein n=1 Tax=Paenibacillus sp. PL2-23 TaxID=2100729 RepID=UPI0030F8E97A